MTFCLKCRLSLNRKSGNLGVDGSGVVFRSPCDFQQKKPVFRSPREFLAAGSEFD